MISDRRPHPDRRRPAPRGGVRVLAPVAGLVCDGPFSEARDYAALVLDPGATLRAGEAAPGQAARDHARG